MYTIQGASLHLAVEMHTNSHVPDLISLFSCSSNLLKLVWLAEATKCLGFIIRKKVPYLPRIEHGW